MAMGSKRRAIGKLGEHTVTVVAPSEHTLVFQVGTVASKRIHLVKKAAVLTARGGKVFSLADRFKAIVGFVERVPRETDFVRVRLRAFIYLMLFSGLRPRECLALNLDQVIEEISPSRARIAHTAALGPSQRADGRRARRVEARQFSLPPIVVDALVVYVRAAIDRGWIERGHWRVPLFLGSRGRRGAQGHDRLKLASITRSWRARLRALGMPHYTLHDLRHEAIRAYVGTPEEKARFGCVSVAQAEAIYTDADPVGLIHIVREAENFIREVARKLGIDDDDESLRDLLACEYPGPTEPPAVS